MTDDERQGPMGLERGLDLLELIAKSPQDECTFTSLMQATGFGKPVLSRLLKSLKKRGLIMRDDDTRTFRRGPALLTLTAGMEWAPRSRKALSFQAEPLLLEISKQFDQSTMCLHWSGQRIECVTSIIPNEGLAAWTVGQHHENLYYAPWGWISAHLGGRQELLDRQLEEHPERQEAAQKGLEDLSRQGWIGYKGRHCYRVAAPVFCAGNRYTGVMGSFLNPLAMTNYDLEDFGKAMLDASRSCSAALGWKKPQKETEIA